MALRHVALPVSFVSWLQVPRSASSLIIPMLCSSYAIDMGSPHAVRNSADAILDLGSSQIRLDGPAVVQKSAAAAHTARWRTQRARTAVLPISVAR